MLAFIGKGRSMSELKSSASRVGLYPSALSFRLCNLERKGYAEKSNKGSSKHNGGGFYHVSQGLGLSGLGAASEVPGPHQRQLTPDAARGRARLLSMISVPRTLSEVIDRSQPTDISRGAMWKRLRCMVDEGLAVRLPGLRYVAATSKTA